MENLNISHVLERSSQYEAMRSILLNFEDQKKDNTSIRRGIYVYGMPGAGKTCFVNEVLRSLDYDIIQYDAGDVRNKAAIESITQNNMADKNVMHMFNKRTKKIAVVMDEIDGMNSGDKGGINTLIRLVREKKTKKQKSEDITYNPIICIGNYKIDKKIKELMKVCHNIELKQPTQKQISVLVHKLIPESIDNKELADNIIQFAQQDLRRLHTFYTIYQRNGGNLEMTGNIFGLKTHNEDTKSITRNLIQNHHCFSEHQHMINETDRTIIGLLWHENIIDTLCKLPLDKAMPIYHKILKNICFADYIDRITFQKQIWQFNEMSSIIKTFYSQQIYHDNMKKECLRPSRSQTEIRFTKVLTKYSTEYNNSVFIQCLCHKTGMDKRDLQAYFLKLKHMTEEEQAQEMGVLDSFGISSLDLNRMIRYLECTTTNKRSITSLEDEVDGMLESI